MDIIDGHDRICLVMAHPDDETMFFTPTLLTLRELLVDFEKQVHIVCFTNGNNQGLGKLREEELNKCLSTLYGISGNTQVVIYDRPEFRDGTKYMWDVSLMTKLLTDYCRERKIDWLFTFDRDGVSHHSNHKACWRTCADVLDRGGLVKIKGAFQLTSLPLIVKYTGIVGTVLWILCRQLLGTREHIFLVRPCYLQMFKGMHCHKSQLTWYRVLFVLFSV
ncbi:N-acetylglucosaminyl-phosphatidylinositol de-N-acetylase [Gregarina niphandrodes]|uniref:N-acetylglucosaminylphosphatidylinositol deacetylase n=1 Tax=Gregarina niphandrodes TaxID=110365 RepID=A0A023AX02_GRENI|nr:N-acetylglucosaminyl-phosphatidylinositol de-N-acetylase [Gregarina niphandrodes]EZG43112.1 N-acetylglucosaminyl-phosphatidylinositol de-N-acetylase [Gregarina niphandrodes]|eukprot:XP_011133624.1 N-acetylglucosaminyl-phosphatidylinositol de-N-acetylase [Gregarina niphandrodes]